MTQQDKLITHPLSPQITPRVIRAKDAHRYLGMSRAVFNLDVRPYVTVMPIGKQGIGFDRLDLDAWWEQYKRRNERPAESQQSLGGTLCQSENIDEPVSTGVGDRIAGLSTKSGRGNDYILSLTRISQMKPKHS
jgi:hypothetical protein